MRYVLRWLAAGCLSVALCAPASAVVIGFSPDAGTVMVGSRFGLNIVVSDLHSPVGAEIVSAFDVDVLYDSSLLSGVDFLFSDALGLANIDTFAASAFLPGRIDLANLSLLANADLLALQGDSVVLGRLIFDAIGIGSALFAFDMTGASAVNLVGSDPFASLPIARAGSELVEIVSPVQVGEPAAPVLFGLALLGMALARRAHKGRASS